MTLEVPYGNDSVSLVGESYALKVEDVRRSGDWRNAHQRACDFFAPAIKYFPRLKYEIHVNSVVYEFDMNVSVPFEGYRCQQRFS